MVVMSISTCRNRGRQYLLPGLEGVTPAVSGWVVANPSSSTTILDNRLVVVGQVGRFATNEVEVIRRGVNDLEAFLRDGSGIT